MRESANVPGSSAARLVRSTIIVLGIALALLVPLALLGYAVPALLVWRSS